MFVVICSFILLIAIIFKKHLTIELTWAKTGYTQAKGKEEPF
ncbi:MAG: hypothetical protein ACR2J3_01645 [Aridibacter sp.]